jgi:S-adenosylmethionine hydrolase
MQPIEPYRSLTLLSDFGLSDGYVGMMKGAITQVNASLNVIDLTHQIPPQNIALARFTLMTAYPYFPAGTVHVAVVDPGVGGTRRAIALAVGEDAAQPTAFLVGPDNGLFSGVLTTQPIIAAVELTVLHYWRSPVPSATFHGRDIFAPVGAHLASGVPLTQVGQSIAPETLVTLDVPQCSEYEAPSPLSNSLLDGGAAIVSYRHIAGCIQAIDHFGNLVTNIPGAWVLGKCWSLSVNGATLPGEETYGDCPLGELLAIVGSHGWVEIAVNGGSAQARLKTDLGDHVCAVVEKAVSS